MQEIIEYLTQYGPFWTGVFILLIALCIIVPIVRFIIFIIHRIRKYVFLKKYKLTLHYNKQEVIATVKSNMTGQENVFLVNDITLEIADSFCRKFLESIRISNIVYNREKSVANTKLDDESKYKQKISNIKVDETRISYDNNHYTLFNWKEHKLKPLTQRDEMKQFLITLGEYIKAILNTESAKELIQLKDIEDVQKLKWWFSPRSSLWSDFDFAIPNSKFKQFKEMQREYEITISEPQDDDANFYTSRGLIIRVSYKSPNPLYKEPPAPQKWY